MTYLWIPECVLIVVAMWILVAEPLFYIWYLRALRVAQVTGCGPPETTAERDELLDRILQQPNVMDMVAGWFRSSTMHTINAAIINRENVLELIATTFFPHTSNLKMAEEEWCNSALEKLCTLHSVTLSTEPNTLRCMKHLTDPVIASWRPLWFYVGVITMQAAASAVLVLRGYTRHSSNGVRYWYHSGARGDSPLLNSPAMVLFHGVGIGLPAYIGLLCNGITCSHQFVFETPWISMNPFASPIASTTLVGAVAEAMKLHRVEKATFVGHSYGTVHITWILRQRPDLVQRLVLVDPVALLLLFPDVCYNFLYKTHTTALAKIVNQVVSLELGISTTIRRHLNVAESCLFPDMLPPDSVILLSEYDHIVPTRAIYINVCKLAHKSVQTVVMSKLQHGTALLFREKRRLIVDAINGDPLNQHDLLSKF